MNPLVFLVDDDEDDRMLIRDALADAAPRATFVEAENGAELMERLASGPGTYLVKPLPDLIVLDMNMPKMTGMEALKKLRAVPLFREIPTVMLSTSSNPDLIQDALTHGVQAYLIKPHTYDEYEEMARSLAARYLQAVQ